MKNAHGREMTCQETRSDNFECGESAVVIVDNGDSRPYWMCLYCADHNKSNRRAVVYFVKKRG